MHSDGLQAFERYGQEREANWCREIFNRINKCGNLFCGDMLEMFSGKGLLKYHFDLLRYGERILKSVFWNYIIIRSKVCRMTSSALCLSGSSVCKDE